MERQLATTTLWQLQYIQYSMSQSAAHDEIHVADAADEWLAESQGNLAVFARRKFKAGVQVSLASARLCSPLLACLPLLKATL